MSAAVQLEIGTAYAILTRLSARVREFVNYDYKCPRAWLQELRQIEQLVARSRLRYKIRSLRTHSTRFWSETRQAALFAYGMSRRMPDFQFDFACVEHADYDAVIRWRRHADQFFTPIQLKEYVPQELNPKLTLETILEQLSRYSDSSDLVVVIYLNRTFRLPLQPIYCPPLKLGGVCLVGGIARNRWILLGDLLDQVADISIFSYP
jgi:hypothetical protein